MRILLSLLFFLFIVVSVTPSRTQSSTEEAQTQAGQNRFEGYNIIVDAPDVQPKNPMHLHESCATRYVPTDRQITITDLNSATPMKLQSCTGGNFAPVRQLNATTASVTANGVDYKWCFTGEDKLYRITFQGDQYTPKVIYNWIPTPDERTAGVYNIRDFGAKGDGRTDDTLAIKSAVAYIASRNGGRLFFPDGDYLVGNPPEIPNFKGITLPSGIIIEGTASLTTASHRNNVIHRSSSRITLAGANRAIFRLGECTERVTVRDIELHAQGQQNTYGIEGVGAHLSSQDFFIDRVSFSNFFRGFYVHALPVTDQGWQMDFVKITNSRFFFNSDAAIWIDIWNTNWAIRGTLIQMPPKKPNALANGIYAFRVGMILIEDTFAGAPAGSVGGDFINLVVPNALTVIGSECEKTTRSLVLGDAHGTSGLSNPTTLINNVFDDPIEIKGRWTLVSTGNHYGANTVKLNPEARVYSTGDRFCYDGLIAGCATGAGPTNFIGGKVIFSTGQPADGTVPGRPTVFGHDVQFNAPIQLPNLPHNQLPAQNVGNGSFVYCTNCRRSTAPCQAGGNGAPAMHVGGKWECL